MPHRSIRTRCLVCPEHYLRLVEKSGLSYLACEQCGGHWIDEQVWMSLIEQARPGADNAFLVHNDGSQRRNCPICAERMDVAWMLFLQIERCQEHGLWFDPGKFERALAGDFGQDVLDQVSSQVQARQKAQEQRGNRPTQPSYLLSKLRGWLR